MRIVAIDYGLKRCGIAICDPLYHIPQPYKVVETERIFEELESINKKTKIDRIVVGIPQLKNEESKFLLKKIEELVENLSDRYGISVELVDESFTTEEAEEILKLAFKDWRKRKKFKDAISASIILEKYLKSGGKTLF